MKSSGQFFCERWTGLIIRDLAAGAEPFAELKRGVPLMQGEEPLRRRPTL